MKTLTTSTIALFVLLTAQKALSQIIQVDKAKHFTTGIIVGNGTQLIAYKFTHNKRSAMLIGFGTGVVMGIAKEIYDGHSGTGTVDFADAVWTSVGSAVGTLSFSFLIPQNRRKPIFVDRDAYRLPQNKPRATFVGRDAFRRSI